VYDLDRRPGEVLGWKPDGDGGGKELPEHAKCPRVLQRIIPKQLDLARGPAPFESRVNGWCSLLLIPPFVSPAEPLRPTLQLLDRQPIKVNRKAAYVPLYRSLYSQLDLDIDIRGGGGPPPASPSAAPVPPGVGDAAAPPSPATAPSPAPPTPPGSWKSAFLSAATSYLRPRTLLLASSSPANRERAEGEEGARPLPFP